MSEDLKHQVHGAFNELARLLDFPKLAVSLAEILSSRKRRAHMARQSEEFYPQAAKRLFLAVVNQAIFDVLENKEEAKAAEQWLLSRDFDTYAALLDYDTKVSCQGEQRPAA